MTQGDGVRRRRGGRDSIDQARRNAQAATQANSVQSDRSTATPKKPSEVKRVSYLLFSRYRKVEGWTPNIVTAAMLLVFVRVASAIFSGISDCDETYNYWEPLHYLVFGYGFETWEYSPKFALRSYAFLTPFQIVARLAAGSFEPLDFMSRILAFKAVRVTLAILSTAADVSLYDATVWRFGKGPARALLVFLVAAPGMFRSSVEFLPSTIAMIAFSGATAMWMVGEFLRAIFLVAFAAIFGWPFAAILGLPMAIHIIFRKGMGFFTKSALAAGVAFVVATVFFDTYYYGFITLSPLNLVLYNVFPEEDAGSHLFGVEDWTFYALNLILNLNLAAIFAAMNPIAWAIHSAGLKVWKNKAEEVARVIFLSPAWIWLLIFFNQPHKEERFLSPVYPALLLIAAVTFDDILRCVCGLNIGALPAIASTKESPSEAAASSPVPQPARPSSSEEPATSGPPAAQTVRRKESKAARVIYRTLTLMGLLAFIAISSSRSIAVVKNYNAPFDVFSAFSRIELQGGLGPRNAPQKFSQPDTEVNICIGKEWYRFPTHFYLPGARFRVRFTRSSFRGLLPKYFDESRHGTRVEPMGMNMYNKEDPKQYIADPSTCHYFVDLILPQDDPAENPIPEEDRMIVASEEFVDKERSPRFHRSFYIPGITEERNLKALYVIYRNVRLLPPIYENP